MFSVLLPCLILWNALLLGAFPLDRQSFLMVGGKDYYISLDKSNWFEATNRCRQKGGFLLNLESQEELQLLSPFLHPAYSYWLSINDLGVRGVYVSEATGLEAPFLNWSAGQPDNSDGDDRCVELWPSTSSQFRMNDLSCRMLVAFICQLN
ncbi:C-type lectin 37Db [Drosophila subpulchrella]|uniref:C-type lectin 37Db n=1 Tax=Drosophila subpulchrella TaxID=1486046 RepID=UPI0018A13B03|nr:C-type lectin 37Db [Drosophila subpulchrella]